MYAWMLHTGLNGAHYEQCLLVFKNKNGYNWAYEAHRCYEGLAVGRRCKNIGDEIIGEPFGFVNGCFYSPIQV